MNDLQKQLEKLSKKLEKETASKLTPDELFSKDFLSKYSIHNSIRDIFVEADVDFSHIVSLSDDEKRELMSVLSSKTKIKSWDDFLKTAKNFQAEKKARSSKIFN